LNTKQEDACLLLILVVVRQLTIVFWKIYLSV